MQFTLYLAPHGFFSPHSWFFTILNDFNARYQLYYNYDYDRPVSFALKWFYETVSNLGHTQPTAALSYIADSKLATTLLYKNITT